MGADPALEAEIRELEAKLDKADPFVLLGVAPGSSELEVKTAFHKLSRRLHPDRHFRKDLGPLKARMLRVFRALSAAHQTLTDPARRAAYLAAHPVVVNTGVKKWKATDIAAAAAAMSGGGTPHKGK